MNSLPLKENLKKYTCTSSCPVRNVISRFSGKWAMLILCILAENPATRFNAIGKAIPDISPKVLTETLRSRRTDNTHNTCRNSSTCRILSFSPWTDSDASYKGSHQLGCRQLPGHHPVKSIVAAIILIKQSYVRSNLYALVSTPLYI